MDWKDYFINSDLGEGFGTTYERFILHQYFARLKNKYNVESVLEAPSYGMTGISGINSMWWAHNDLPVTVTDDNQRRINLIKRVWQEISFVADFVCLPYDNLHLPFSDKSFDMSWNFAALWFVPNLEKFFKELVHVTRKVIFICIPNTLNIFYRLRLALQGNSQDLYIDNFNPAKIQKTMLNLNWHQEEHGYFDIPPWPDIAMKKEDLLRKFGLTHLATKMDANQENSISILDYFSGKNRSMEKQILRYAFLENGPQLLQIFWAHHQYFIFVPSLPAS